MQVTRHASWYREPASGQKHASIWESEAMASVITAAVEAVSATMNSKLGRHINSSFFISGFPEAIAAWLRLPYHVALIYAEVAKQMNEFRDHNQQILLSPDGNMRTLKSLARPPQALTHFTLLPAPSCISIPLTNFTLHSVPSCISIRPPRRATNNLPFLLTSLSVHSSDQLQYPPLLLTSLSVHRADLLQQSPLPSYISIRPQRRPTSISSPILLTSLSVHRADQLQYPPLLSYISIRPQR
ncbi:hypothetical protein J6590_037345 [Homalodisca vitripennis]|nr:hypothetical protein J6590_037345 [Homalodisca vitripennis]